MTDEYVDMEITIKFKGIPDPISGGLSKHDKKLIKAELLEALVGELYGYYHVEDWKNDPEGKPIKIEFKRAM